MTMRKCPKGPTGKRSGCELILIACLTVDYVTHTPKTVTVKKLVLVEKKK